MEAGFIKLHREMFDFEWYTDPLTTRLFTHLILKANHKDSFFRGKTIYRGQVITGRKQLCYETGISEQSIRTSLNRLKSTSNITIKSTSKYSIITILSYNKYQDTNQQTNQQLTSNQPATNQQLTTYKNIKNLKNEKNEKNNTNSDFELFWKKYPANNRRKKKDCKKIYDSFVKSKELADQFDLALANYKKSKPYKSGYVQNSITWFRDWETWLDYSDIDLDEEKKKSELRELFNKKDEECIDVESKEI